jgi:hypothetical protein
MGWDSKIMVLAGFKVLEGLDFLDYDVDEYIRTEIDDRGEPVQREPGLLLCCAIGCSGTTSSTMLAKLVGFEELWLSELSFDRLLPADDYRWVEFEERNGVPLLRERLVCLLENGGRAWFLPEY